MLPQRCVPQDLSLKSWKTVLPSVIPVSLRPFCQPLNCDLGGSGSINGGGGFQSLVGVLKMEPVTLLYMASLSSPYSSSNALQLTLAIVTASLSSA